jgi:hypothetical protein
MKKLTFVFAFFFLLGCNQETNQVQQVEEIQAQLDQLNQSSELEKSTRNLVESSIEDLNSSDWKIKIGKYWPNDDFERFAVVHQKFRDAYTDYKMTIKHLTIDGNQGIMWGRVSAIHSAKFDMDVTKETEATGKPVEWDEVWYFEIVDGKYDDKFESTINEISKMRHLGIKCLPEN